MLVCSGKTLLQDNRTLKKDIIKQSLFNLLFLLQNSTAVFIIISSVHLEFCSEYCRISAGVVKHSYFCIVNGLGGQLKTKKTSQFILHIIHITQSFIVVHKCTCLGITKREHSWKSDKWLQGGLNSWRLHCLVRGSQVHQYCGALEAANINVIKHM